MSMDAQIKAMIDGMFWRAVSNDAFLRGDWRMGFVLGMRADFLDPPRDRIVATEKKGQSDG